MCIIYGQLLQLYEVHTDYTYELTCYIVSQFQISCEKNKIVMRFHVGLGSDFKICRISIGYILYSL